MLLNWTSVAFYSTKCVELFNFYVTVGCCKIGAVSIHPEDDRWTSRCHLLQNHLQLLRNGKKPVEWSRCKLSSGRDWQTWWYWQSTRHICKNYKCKNCKCSLELYGLFHKNTMCVMYCSCCSQYFMTHICNMFRNVFISNIMFFTICLWFSNLTCHVMFGL